MFWIKKLVTFLIFPLIPLFFLLFLGLFWSWRQRRRDKTGPGPRRLILVASIGLFLVCSGPTGDLMLLPLERQYPPLTDLTDVADAKFVVVLGAGLTGHRGAPITSQLSTSSLYRLTEGVRILRQLPDAKLVVGGAAVGLHRAGADALAELASDLGVDPARIIRADQALDTSGEAAALVAASNPGDPIVLVTEASHMPRAVKIFERAGLKITAAPTHHQAEKVSLHPAILFPSARKVRNVERALYEYVGLLWVGMGGA